MKTTIKAIREHFKAQGYESKHNFKGLKHAANTLAKETNMDAWDLLLLVIENKPVGMSHSYGFHTRTGRYLIETFQNYYYQWVADNDYNGIPHTTV